MLLTIHNLPSDIRYPEIKTLLLSKCGLQNVILDNLTSEGNGKKVTVGVVEEEDAAILVRKINGLYLNGQQLYVEDVRQKKSASEQPFRSMNPHMQESMEEGYNSMPQKGMGNTVTPAVQPMMAMYYVPTDYAQQAQAYGAESWGMMGAQGFSQSTQDYTMTTENVQSSYMSAGGFPQPAQSSHFGSLNKFTKNQDYSQDRNPRDVARENVNYYEEDASKPKYGRPSDEAGQWRGDDVGEPPARDRSQGSREPSWQHHDRPRDFRDESWQPRGSGPRRPPRTDERNSGRTFGNVPPAFGGLETRHNEFSGRSEFPETSRPNDRPGFGRNNQSDFERPANRQESERPNNRPQIGHPNNRVDLGRPNIRPEFGHPSNRQEFVRPSKPEFRPNKPGFRPNKPEFRPNKPEFRPNKPEFSGRGGRSDRGGSRPQPEPRKRRFDEALPIEAYVERPERLSRPVMSPPKPKHQRHEPNKFANAHQATLTPKQLKSLKYTATNSIVHDLFYNLRVENPEVMAKQEARKFITSRLDEMVEIKTMVVPQEVIALYRTKYPRVGDMNAYNKILANVAARKASEAGKTAGNPGASTPAANPAASKPAVNPAVSKPALNPTASKPVAGKPAATKPAKKKKLIPLAPGQKVPSFPGGDKSVVAQQKKHEKEGYVPMVPLVYERPIEEELFAIGKLFIDELQNGDNDMQQRAYNMVDKRNLIGEVKQVLNQHISRRITGEGLKVIRIMGSPRLPKRPEIEDFLLRYGVISLRKSEKAKLYTAALQTYEAYDTLCSMDPVVIGFEGNVVTFKPFHLTAKPRADQKLIKKERMKMVQTMIDRSGINLLDKDWPAQEAAYKEKEAAEALLKEKQLAEAKERQIAAAKAKKAAANKEKDIADQNPAEAAIEGESAAEIQVADNNTAKDENAPKDNAIEVSEDLPSQNKVAAETQNDYLHEDFHVIDEVNETDSDVEYIGKDSEVVNLVDDGNSEVEKDDDDIGNDDNNDVDEDHAEDEDEIDDVDMEIDDLNEDDLEDY